jgi:hypothetical protein
MSLNAVYSMFEHFLQEYSSSFSFEYNKEKNRLTKKQILAAECIFDLQNQVSHLHMS